MVETSSHACLVRRKGLHVQLFALDPTQNFTNDSPEEPRQSGQSGIQCLPRILTSRESRLTNITEA